MSEEEADEKVSKVRERTKKKREIIKFFAGSACKYPVVREAAKKLGWKVVTDEASDKLKSTCNILWIDTSNVNDYFISMKPWQCINHFPGMINIARKTRLAENLVLMKKKFRKHYSFFPSTYILPRDKFLMKKYFEPSGESKDTFIVKPDGGCQGKGIFLTKNYDTIEELRSTHVVQRYIGNPLLIEKKKFDLRIYVLITSCQPLRIYLFRDGLVRICTEDFVKPNEENIDDRCMHLTNYAVNKFSANFEGIEKEEVGSKRSVKWFLSWLEGKNGSDAVEAMWSKISQICIKTIISIIPNLSREYEAVFGVNNDGGSGIHPKADCCESETVPVDCNVKTKINEGSAETPRLKKERKSTSEEQFKSAKNNNKITGSRCIAILGFDIMIDSKLKPHLIEVNQLPSFATDSQLDESIKSKVVHQALSVFKAAASDQFIHDKKERLLQKDRLYGKFNESKVTSIPEHDAEENEVSAGKAKNLSPTIDLMETCSVEENVTKIYAAYAPEKLDKVKVLLRKYKGYEKWLIQKLRGKYCTSSKENDSKIKDDSSIKPLRNSTDESDTKKESTSCYLPTDNAAEEDHRIETNLISENYFSKDDCLVENAENNKLEEYEADPGLTEEGKILEDAGDYDRIYPPKQSSYCTPPYQEMRKYAFQEDLKHQMRLICPLWQIRKNIDDNEVNITPIAKQNNSVFKGNTHSSRSEWLVSGNVHVRKREMTPTKITPQPPTQKQIDATDRLSRGFSVETPSRPILDSKKSANENEFMNRLSRVEEEGREIRRRNEDKFVTKSQLAMKPINIEFSHQSSLLKCGGGARCYVDFTGRKLDYK